MLSLACLGGLSFGSTTLMIYTTFKSIGYTFPTNFMLIMSESDMPKVMVTKPMSQINFHLSDKSFEKSTS